MIDSLAGQQRERTLFLSPLATPHTCIHETICFVCNEPRPESTMSIITRSSTIIIIHHHQLWLSGLSIEICGLPVYYLHYDDKCKLGLKSTTISWTDRQLSSSFVTFWIICRHTWITCLLSTLPSSVDIRQNVDYLSALQFTCLHCIDTFKHGLVFTGRHCCDTRERGLYAVIALGYHECIY